MPNFVQGDTHLLPFDFPIDCSHFSNRVPLSLVIDRKENVEPAVRLLKNSHDKEGKKKRGEFQEKPVFFLYF